MRQRLRDLGAKPCHKNRLLRGWSQMCSYDRKHSPAKDFFPLELLQAEQLIKVGFVLKSDRGHIRAKLAVHFGGVVVLNTVFSMDSYHKGMGVRAAVGQVLEALDLRREDLPIMGLSTGSGDEPAG